MKWVITLLCLGCLAGGSAFGQSTRSATFRQIANRGYLGVGVVELTDDRVKALNLKNDQGVEVKLVDPNSPAARTGLRENDVILEVNGKPVDGIDQFQNLIGDAGPGVKLNLTVWRNGAKQTLTATLQLRPFFVYGQQMPALVMPPLPPIPPNAVAPFPVIPTDSPMVGFLGEPLTPQLAEYFGVKNGVLVQSVNPNTPASHAGLKAGDVVTKVNGTQVTSPHEITGLVRSSGKKVISFTVVRNKKEITLNIEIAAIASDRADL